MKKILLFAAFISFSLNSNAQCGAVATLNENFDSFTTATLPQNCWTASVPAPRVSVDGSTSKSVTLYSYLNGNTAFYLVTPELSTIDGNHKLSFDALKQSRSMPGAANTITIEVGTILTSTDYASFTSVGTPISLTSTTMTNFEFVIPASATHKHIAFKVLANSDHMAASLDNVVYQSTTLGVKDSELASFDIYPNPSIDRNITISANINDSLKNNISVYSITGAKVFETELSNNSNTRNIDLSGLTAGVYILKLQTEKNTVAKKLILR